MTVKFSVLNERIQYLRKELGDSLVVLEMDNNFTRVEITFDHASDVLRLFHAGVHAGLDLAHEVRKEFA
jgi:hypothetical protein